MFIVVIIRMAPHAVEISVGISNFQTCWSNWHLMIIHWICCFSNWAWCTLHCWTHNVMGISLLPSVLSLYHFMCDFRNRFLQNNISEHLEICFDVYFPRLWTSLASQASQTCGHLYVIYRIICKLHVALGTHEQTSAITEIVCEAFPKTFFKICKESVLLIHSEYSLCLLLIKDNLKSNKSSRGLRLVTTFSAITGLIYWAFKAQADTTFLAPASSGFLLQFQKNIMQFLSHFVFTVGCC